MRNDITILVPDDNKSMIPLDMYESESVTLNCLSNLLSGIDDITCSVSQTIKIPHTAKNDRLMALATSPSHNSNIVRSKISCNVLVNGIDIIGPAWCYVTDSDVSDYEIVILFGLMQNLNAWLSAGEGLRDLDTRNAYNDGTYGTGVDGAIWDEGAGASYWAGTIGYSHYDWQHRWSCYFGTYNRGVDSRKLCNIHPWVSLREIYERILRENDLDFHMPSEVLTDMANVGILLTPLQKGTRNASSNVITANMGCKYFSSYYMALYSNVNNDFIAYSRFLHYGDGDVVVHFPTNEIYLRGDKSAFTYSSNYTYKDFIDTLDTSTSYLRFVNNGVETLIHPVAAMVNGEKMYKFTLPTSTPSYPYDTQGNPVVSEGVGTFTFVLHSSDTIIEQCYLYQDGNEGFHIGTVANNTFSDGLVMYLGYQLKDVGYPTYGRYNLVENLPDITQIEFIKAVCQLYGLFPVVNADVADRIDFVPFSILSENMGQNSVDWSDKLIDTRTLSPAKISFVLDPYDAQHNWIRYKEDDKEAHPNNDAGSIDVNRDYLDKDKDLVEFPWAATNGNLVTQYVLSEDGESADFIDCEYRLMAISGIIEDPNRDYLIPKTLSFPKSLSVEQILSNDYSSLVSAVASPKVITEYFRLNENDIKTLDFTCPVYLKKYGRYFAVKSVQWSSDSEKSKVELIIL